MNVVCLDTPKSNFTVKCLKTFVARCGCCHCVFFIHKTLVNNTLHVLEEAWQSNDYYS